MKASINWGDEELEFDLPGGWELAGVVEPAEACPVTDVGSELRRALDEPVGSEPLSTLARGKRNVAIVVDDVSRPTPAHLFIDGVIDEISAAGVPESDIVMVTGTGTHRPMTDGEMEAKVGKRAIQRVRWLNHDFRAKSEMVDLGRTGRGTRVELNRSVAAADLVVLVGTIEPHPHAGFGGGFKNIVPGVASARTIGENHLLSATRENFSMVGWEPERNPMRLDAEEAGRMLPGDTFMVNTVLTQDLEIARIVAGDPVRAQREGVDFSRSLYGAPVESPADVVISSSHPMDHDLRQGVKAVANTFQAARRGGLVLAAMRCLGGAGDMHVPKLKVPGGRGFIRAMARALLPVVRYAPGIPVEERFYMYTALRTALRNNIMIFAPELPLELRKTFPTVFSTGTFQETLDEAAREYPEAGVLVFPKGGITYPVLKGQD